MTNDIELKIKKLQWQCRRGMLEVDLYLMTFLEKGCALLSESDHHLFEDLLKEPDPVLLSWLTGQARPEQEDMANLVQTIIKTRRAHS